MKKILPYPLLFVSLVLFWLLLNSFTRAQFILGLVIAFGACRVMMALEPQKNHIRSPRMMIWLLYAASIDVLRSNIAVVRLILSPGRQRHPGFVVIPLELQNRTALAVLACMITASPARHGWTIMPRAGYLPSTFSTLKMPKPGDILSRSATNGR